jgi:hypothetical protein
MIRNEQQLTVVREQLRRVEAALDSLRRDVLPQNADLYHLMAEPCLDTIGELRGQIDAYPGSAAFSEVTVAEPVDGIGSLDADSQAFVLRNQPDTLLQLPSASGPAPDAAQPDALDQPRLN